MKRLAIALSIIAALGMLFTGLPTLARPILIPHENPATAKSSLDVATLLLSYRSIFDLAAIQQYQNAQDMLQEMDRADIPEELRYIIDRYNDLSTQLFDTMNNLEFLLDQSSALFSQKQFPDAEEKLDQARIASQDIQFLLVDIEAATDSIGDSLGVFAAAATSQTQQAYDRLEQSLKRLGQLSEELNQLLDDLIEDPSAAITTSFYHPTLLEVSAPETGHPGLPFTISGRISSTGDNIDRTIKVLLDDIPLAEQATRGQFSLEITPPPPAATGEHGLTVIAVPQGHYAGAEKRLTISISRLPMQADIQTPQLAIMPNTIQISGRVYHQLRPVPDARINLVFKGSSSMTRTDADGSFTVAVKPPQLAIATPTSANPFYATTSTTELPLDLSLVGQQDLTISVNPVEPWYAPLEVKRHVFTINPINTGLMMLLILVSIGLIAYKRDRTQPQEETVISPPPMREPAAFIPTRRQVEFTGIKGRILATYTSGLEAVTRVTGLTMAPHNTLREFLTTIAPRLPNIITPFTELTTMAEIALYSAHSPDEAAARRAVQLAESIKQELYRGTA